jgi:hypothetical protein
MSTVIVIQLNAAGRAVQNGATQVTMPIELAKRPRCSLLYRRRSAQFSIAAVTRGQTARCPLPPSQHLDRGDAAPTIPIVPNHPRLRSIRLL